MKPFSPLAIALVLLLSRPLVVAGQPTTVYFDDASPDTMVLGNGAYYEIGLRKSNGSIAYIADKTTGQHVTLGSRHECLWGVTIPNRTPNYLGGCSYREDWPNQFSYAWSDTTGALTLSYTPAPTATQALTVQVVITPSDEPWFDMCLALDNHWGYRLDGVLFPSDLVFAEADMREALLPILPGVVLGAKFFQQHRAYSAEYPGYPGLFADYVAIQSAKGRLAIYSVYENDTLRPVTLGFMPDDEYIKASTFSQHTFGARIRDGESWTSPPVRVRVSQPFADTLRAYRADNGLDQLPSLAQKLGPRYDPVVRSPLYKADAVQLGQRFSQYAGLLSRLPSPGIFHPAAFQPGGHDESYPDFLPPDPAWGSTADFAAMVQQAQAHGLLVMPYTNPTWWDDESPTLRSLTLKDMAALDINGTPIRELYGPRAGYVMSPYAPQVQQRLAQLSQQMTVDVSSDLVFEDQVGARAWLFDYNAASPSPMAYMQGWLEHTRAFSHTLLMTELGFDRLAETEVGFHGSVLLPERTGGTDGWWGAGQWQPYPLATMLARDKALFYQHDLAPETMTHDKQTLTWNLAMGYMLSYDLATGGLSGPWLTGVSAFQTHVLARYAREPITSFDDLGPDVTRTTFETVSVVANWDHENSYTLAGHTLPPQGVVVTSTDGSVTAGVFTAYNGAALSAGDHYLIEERDGGVTTIRQPMGSDTALLIQWPDNETSGQAVEARAYSAGGQIVATVPATVTAQGVAFTYRREVGGQGVAYYKVAAPGVMASPVFMPLVLRVD